MQSRALVAEEDAASCCVSRQYTGSAEKLDWYTEITGSDACARRYLLCHQAVPVKRYDRVGAGGRGAVCLRRAGRGFVICVNANYWFHYVKQTHPMNPQPRLENHPGLNPNPAYAPLARLSTSASGTGISRLHYNKNGIVMIGRIGILLT